MVLNINHFLIAYSKLYYMVRGINGEPELCTIITIVHQNGTLDRSSMLKVIKIFSRQISLPVSRNGACQA